MTLLPLVIAGIHATPGVTAPPRVAMAAVGPGEVAIVAIVFGAVISIVAPLTRAWTRRMNDGGHDALPSSDVVARLERIEHAVESIALEVERISEGQRFVTQLMAKPDARRAVGSGDQ